MDFNDTPEEAAFRTEAREFLKANAEPKSRARPVFRLGDFGGDGLAAERIRHAAPGENLAGAARFRPLFGR